MTSSSFQHKALFLDRDGVININHGYVSQIKDFDWLDGIFDLVQDAIKLNYKIIIVTNQSGIGRGYYSEKDFHSLTDWMLEEFANRQLHIDRVYFCPHHPTHAIPPYNILCNCRKPLPGMAFQALSELSLDLASSVMIGDKSSDIQFAENAKIGSAFLLSTNADACSVDKRQYSINVKEIHHLSEIDLSIAAAN